jgi:hypothetical protein
MAAECSICAHARVQDIHRTLDAGDGVNATARAFGVSPTSLKRHLVHRSPPGPTPLETTRSADRPAPANQPRDELDQADQAGPQAVIEPDLPLDDLEGRLHQVTRSADRLRVAAEAGTLRERGSALGECRKTVETMMSLAEQLRRGRETALLQSAEWTALRTIILDALRLFPEARGALGAALRAHEGR